jgi:hypothetical protein
MKLKNDLFYLPYIGGYNLYKRSGCNKNKIELI